MSSRSGSLMAAGAIGIGLLTLAIAGRGLLDRFSAPDPQAVVRQYCVDCHNRAELAGGVSFEGRTLDALHADADVWERAVRKVRTGFMPPAGEPRPERSVLDGFASALETRLDRAAAAAPNPGAVGLARLNRAEYTNAVRDLLAYDASAIVASLPEDDAIQGFDNIADALTVSPTLIQGYVNAALRISREAVGDLAMVPGSVRYDAPAGLSQDRHVDGLPLGTRGGFKFTHLFPLDAMYEFRIAARGAGVLSGQRFCPPPSIDVTVDGKLTDAESTTFRLPLAAGPHTIAVALLDDRRCAGVNELYGEFSAGGGVENVEIQGPFEPSGVGDTPSRRKIFSCYPQRAEEEAACARRILTDLATLAFRKPLAEGDAQIRTLLAFYENGRRAGGDFETGIQGALARVLVDPRFLYRLETEPPGVTVGEPYHISDIELASRLSFFLWSSVPDRPLLELAARGELGDAEVLEREVLRMLDDPRSAALVENFAGQWLKLRELQDALPQDAEFDANLRAAFRRETELLFANIVNDDRSILDLLDADYTHVDERLAEHYGMTGVRGSHMRRVPLAEDSPRRGLLGHGSILTATSVANRTSPVVRGQWIVENLLGATVPPPPPGVEADLSAEEAVPEAKTLRARMELHRTDPVCASCHQLMDPFGFALERFDLVGRWRETDGGEPIDTTAVLVDGTVIDGPLAMRHALLARKDAFATAMTEKLLTYALGRVLEHYDMPAVRRIVERAEREDYRFSAIVLGIAESVPFRMKAKAASADAAMLQAQNEG